MLTFKKLNKDNFSEIIPYTENSTLVISDFSAGFLLMWDSVFLTEFAIFDKTLILKRAEKHTMACFYFPVGKNIPGALKEIEKYALNKNIPLKFYGITKYTMPLIKKIYGKNLSLLTERKWSDYIYKADEMREFKGGKYSGQRNHINKFKKLYPDFTFRKITETDYPVIDEFLKGYGKNKQITTSIEKEELRYTKKYYKTLLNLGFFGAIIFVNGILAGFSIAELCGKTLIIHIEKANTHYEGIYPTIVNEFAKMFSSEAVFINREDDAGDEGLRTSKMQYQPIEILDKYFVTVKKQSELIKSLPCLKTDEITLNEITEKDKVAYYKLYMDKNINKYWGYDYKEDIEIPSENAFYEMMKTDFEKKTFFSLAIRRNSNNAFMGEATFYNFDFDSSVELGIRLFEEYQGHKYAKTAIKLIIDYLSKQTQTRFFKAKYYKENLSSAGLFHSLDFKIINEDETFIYCMYSLS